MTRHRAAWLFLQRRTNLMDGHPKDLLHLAPEPILASKFRSVSAVRYLSVDLNDPHADMNADLTDMPQKDGSFDAIYCSHVLEHIADDTAAMREMHRLLRPGAWALVSVPFNANELTVEDTQETDPRERERRFGQQDHVRLYGRDLPDRLRAVGFDVDVVLAGDFMVAEELKKTAVNPGATVFYCTR